MKGQRLVLAVAITTALASAALSAQDNYETTRIASGVYQFRWIGHNGMFVTTDEGVVAFDPINVDAARSSRRRFSESRPALPWLPSYTVTVTQTIRPAQMCSWTPWVSRTFLLSRTRTQWLRFAHAGALISPSRT